MKASKIVLVLTAVLVLCLTAFTPSAADAKTLTIGMSWAHKNDSLFYAMDETLASAMEKLAPEKGYDKVEWIHVIANDDAQKQASDIEDLITKGVDMIVSYAYDAEAIKSSIASAHEAGIPFICYDRDATDGGEQPDAFIGLDTTDQAYTTGKELFQAMKDAGVTPTDVISIVGSLADRNALNRIEGFKRAADEYGVKITQEVPSEWDSNQALQGFSAAYQGHSNCNTVLIASDFIITSVQSVLEKAGKWIPAGKEGHIWIGSQDVFPISIKFIQDGFIDFDTAYDLEAMAANFAPIAYDILEGKTPADRKVTVSGKVISKSNVDSEQLWAKNYQ
ncbi:MAG: sugar ABC transporter substrate-binding protein [Synergistaceae bacterium]|jgi:ABC-type sugar transport system substrate-binding protein|nr:sugar ABC transporter substrate-binding protein [Synergistaceae bacterium]